MEWVDVRTLNGMTTYHGTTDETGEYWLDGWFSGSSIVKVHLQKEDFRICSVYNNGLIIQTAEIGRSSSGTYCNVTINNGMERTYATMFRAAQRYYYGNVGGLTRPVRLVHAQKLWGIDAAGSSSGINYIVFPNLKVWRYRSNNVEYGTDEIFSTTIHELAHTAHVKTMNAGVIQYSQMDNIIRESWPVAVEWFITGMEYRERGVVSTSATTFNYGDWNYNPSSPPQYPNQQAYQYWTKSTDPEYTSLFINIIDNVNDVNIWGLSGSPNDNVTGYTLANIQLSFLKHVYGLSSLRTQLKANKPVAVTDAQIDQLINAYD